MYTNYRVPRIYLKFFILAFVFVIGGCNLESRVERAISTPTLSLTRPSTVELTFEAWMVNESADHLLLELLREFSNEYPAKISEPVSLTPIDNYALSIRTKQTTGTGSPDVFALYSSYEAWIGLFIELGILNDLDSYFASDFRAEDFYEEALNFFKDDKGHLYGIPRNMEVLALLYDDAAFREIGYDKLPELWEDYETALSKLSDPTNNYHGLCISDSFTVWLLFYYQSGAAPLRQIDRTQAQRAAERLVQLKEQDLATTPSAIGSQSCAVALEEHRVASLIGTYSTFKAIEDDVEHAENIRSAEIPHDINKATLMFVDGYVMSANTKYPEDAWNLIVYLTRENTLKPWTSVVEGISPYKRITYQQTEMDPTLRPFAHGAEQYAKGSELSLLPPETISKLRDAVNNLESGQLNTDQFIEEALSALNQSSR